MNDIVTLGRGTEELFDIDLRYEQDQGQVEPDIERPGEYLGGGRGRVSGERLRGTVRWDLREHTGRTSCDMFFNGIIDTDDGATISFETLGHGFVPDQEAAPSLWDVSASVRFISDDDRYAWLTGRPAAWLGSFDMSTYQHHYQVVRRG